MMRLDNDPYCAFALSSISTCFSLPTSLTFSHPSSPSSSTPLQSNTYHLPSSNRGFTIIELLVVIVVIGILAAISIIAYTGISQRAIDVKLKSDLTNASQQLKLFQVENSAYPITISCEIPDSTANKCITASSDNSYTAYTSDNSSNPQTFTLDAKNGNTTYRITNDSAPVIVTTFPISAIAAITGTTQVGSVLTAGVLTPSGATATYQWQSSTTVGGAYTDIPSATAITYTIVDGDVSRFLKVVATGTGSYTGNQTSPASGSIIAPITAIGAISGTTTAIGNILTAGALTPSGATATYQWQSSISAGGTYTNIAGATASTYTLITGDVGKYIKVVATGSGNYIVTQTSAASAVVSDTNWLAVGNQVWAKANLNVGTMVPGTLGGNNTTNQTNNSIIEKYCYVNNSAYCTTYGALYQWNEAMQYVTTEGAQGICPAGSHIPSDNDWKILEMQLGMTQAQANATSFRGTNQGTQLKSGGTSGLNVPIAGLRGSGGNFTQQGTNTRLWSSSESNISAWYRLLATGSTSVLRDTYDKANGLSVRCLVN